MPLQPFKATVPQDGKSWWLRLGKENLPDKFIFTLLLDMQPEHFLHRMQDVQILSQFGEYTVYSGVFEGERLGLLYPWSIRPFRAARWYRPKLKPVNRSALPTRRA